MTWADWLLFATAAVSLVLIPVLRWIDRACRVIEVGDRGELVKVLKVDHELPPDRTLEQVRDWFAELLGIPAVRP